MADGEGRFSNAVKLKKAGLPTLAVVLLTVFSAPGFWEFFFDKTEDKVDVAYETLRLSFEAQSNELENMREDMREIRTFLREVLWRKARGFRSDSIVHSMPSNPEPASIGLGGGGSVSASSSLSSVAGSLEEEFGEIAADKNNDGVPEVIEDKPAPKPQQQTLPENLEALLKK